MSAGVTAALVVHPLAAAGTVRRADRAARPDARPGVVEVWATYYGWYDNTPPGCATAYSGCARGDGTFTHPITFASDRKEFPVGTVVYYPTVEKYFVMGDDCQECDEDWTGHGPDGGPRFHHVDLWTGGKGGNEFDAINCEDALTQGTPAGVPIQTPFIVHPPAGLPVSTEPLFDPRTGHCYGGARTSATHGRYRNLAAGRCLARLGTTLGRDGVAALEPCGPGPAEDLAYDGAFLMIGDQCLQTATGRIGTRLSFTDCTGGPGQQWEINPDGTIGWVQYARCVADVGGAVELARCSHAATARWAFTSE